MDNSEQISQILTIVLVCMVVILVVLVVIYLMIYLKNKKANNTNLNTNNDSNQKTNIKKAKKTTVNYSKQSVFDFMEFDKIEDNMIIQKDGMRYVMVMQCQGVNYDLLSQAERVGVEEGFLQFLNTLRFPVQLYIQTRTVNLDKVISGYRENVNEIELDLMKQQSDYEVRRNSGMANDEELKKEYYEIVKKRNLLEYGRDIISNTEKMSKNKNVLNNKYYIVIYYYPEEINENLSKSEIQEDAFSELYTRAQTISRILYSCDVSVKVLNSNELIELLYVAYNRDESETFDFREAMQAGYQELYSSAPDIWSKKIKILNEQIQKRGMDIANEVVEQVKTERQKEYELKKDSIDELAKKMALSIIEANDNYIGEDIAQDAINKLNTQINNIEGGNANEK